MRAHRGSSAADGGEGFGVLVGVEVVIFHFSYGTGSKLTPTLSKHTPIVAFKSNGYAARTDARGDVGHLIILDGALAGPGIVADNENKDPDRDLRVNETTK